MMDGLDLTPWIERVPDWWTIICLLSVVGGMATIGFLVGFVATRAEKASERVAGGVFGAGISCAILAFAILIGGSIYYEANLSDADFTSYVADGYGLSSLDCGDLPDDYLKKQPVYEECDAYGPSDDMSTIADARQHANLIIRNDRAYLYGEDGNLMEVKK